MKKTVKEYILLQKRDKFQERSFSTSLNNESIILALDVESHISHSLFYFILLFVKQYIFAAWLDSFLKHI